MIRNAIARPPLAAVVMVALGAAALSANALGGGSGAAASDTVQGQQNKVTVEPYKSRPAPSYRVSLKDGRLFFLTKLDETDSGYVLHTLEGEDIEVDESEVDNIVELEKQ